MFLLLTNTELSLDFQCFYFIMQANLEQACGFPASKMRLFYVDAEMKEVVGREEMRFPQKQLYSYNMQDGDEIHVEPKKVINSVQTSV